MLASPVFLVSCLTMPSCLLPLMCCHCRCCCNSTFLTYIMRQYFNECCLRLAPIDIINNRLGIEGLDSSRFFAAENHYVLLALERKGLGDRTQLISNKVVSIAHHFFRSRVLCIYRKNLWSFKLFKKCISSVRNF